MSDMSDTAVGSAIKVHRYRVFLEDEDGYTGRTMDVRSRSVIGAVAQAQEVFPDYHATKVERLGE